MKEYFAHETAVIDDGCEIGEGTKIWHFSHIMPNCKIGNRCNIGQNVVVSPDVVLGNNVKVQNNVSIYTGVICEDDVFLGPSMVFTNVINPRSAIKRRDEFKTTLVKKGASIGANATIVCGNNILDPTHPSNISHLQSHDEENNNLITPCKCMGSTKFIHIDCLKTWINSKASKMREEGIGKVYYTDKIKCEICNSILPKKIIVNRKEHYLLKVIENQIP